ncbi:MAG: hypothetical protein QG597_4004 [Actinomycetota bacterium]|nr:hypothetical protein [Actinomycetota bacterium]
MSTTSSPQNDGLVTVSEVLPHIRMSRSWLYDALRRQKVHCVRFGRAWRLTPEVVADLIKHGASSGPA